MILNSLKLGFPSEQSMVAKITLSSVLDIDFDCKSLVVGYDIEIFIFPFLVDNDAFFHQVADTY